jgi:hypothetical protein
MKSSVGVINTRPREGNPNKGLWHGLVGRAQPAKVIRPRLKFDLADAAWMIHRFFD